MLTCLHIKNFTIIDQLEIELQAGMTVLTGETGAGKSISIDALALVLGNRADTNAIRTGTERCDISAEFDITHIPAARTWLAEHELSEQDDCILRRSISRDGRSRAFINGQVATLQNLRELGDCLVNIHGQHEHQRLLKRDEQRALLDTFADHQHLLQQVSQLHQQWQEAQTALASLTARTQQQEQQKDLLTFHVQELEALELTEQSITELEQEHQRLANADKLINNCNQALELTSEAESHNAINLLNQAQSSLSSIAHLDPQLNNAKDLLSQALLLTDEAASELRHYAADLSSDPDRLQIIEQRIAHIQDLARKHRVQPQELLSLQQQLQQNLAEIEQADSNQEALEQQIAQLAQAYQTLAARLTASRTQAAERLSQAITASMQELGMPGGQFQATLEPIENFTRWGLDRIEFLVSTNPGQPLQPLTKVASGGELSRISLAIQVITAQQDNTPTLIFDEVDVGIGGRVAEIVGQLLRELGNKAQILCVTHLPQVAAKGHHHLQVSKSTAQGLTSTQIQPLSPQQRTQEIARMLGGIKITANTLAHAEEMLEVV